MSIALPNRPAFINTRVLTNGLQLPLYMTYCGCLHRKLWHRQAMRPKQKTPSSVSDLRTRMRTALLGLEDRDVAPQAHQGAQGLIAGLTSHWEFDPVLRDILDMSGCEASARRLRYR